MNPVQTILCVGGGIIGIFAALRARQLAPAARILLIEQDDALGGLLRSDIHPNGLYFDRGTHVLSETGIAGIDALLFDDLDPAQWRRFRGAERDLCGLFLEESVLEGSPFLPAPSGLVTENLAALVDAERTGSALASNLHDALVAQHGSKLVDAVFRCPVRNLYQRELEELDPFVAGQLPLSRVVCDDLATWLSRMEDGRYRQLVACPDQRSLPGQFTSKLDAFYPRRMGIGQLFSKLARQMSEAGIETRLSTSVTGFNISDGAIASAGLEIGGTSETIDGKLNVVWAAPPFQLRALLGCKKPTHVYSLGWRTIIVDFVVTMNQRLGCYYYIDYGSNDCFRLTNYSALSQEAAARDASPFTLEIWWRGSDLNEAQAKELVAERFLELGLISSSAAISAVRLREATQGAVLATTENMRALTVLAETVKDSIPSNLINIGLLSEPRLFFTGDMLRNAEQRLSQVLG